MSIAVLLRSNPPDRLFSPLESRIFDSVAQHGTCQERGAVGNNGFQGVGRISPENAGKRKKIELCAARLFGARGPDGCPLRQSIKVNLEYEKLVSNDWDHFLRIFTESLILAQNERWRRV